MRGILDVEGWVFQSIITGVKTVVSILSSITSCSDSTAERIRVSQSLRMLETMIHTAQLGDTMLSWFTTEVNLTLDAADNMSALEIQLNVRSMEELSFRVLGFFERPRILRGEEQKVLEMEARAVKMRAAFEARELELKNEESKLHAKLRDKRLEHERLDKELGVAFTRMHQLEAHEEHLASLLVELKSFVFTR